MLLSDWMRTFYEEQKRRGVRGVKLLGTVSNLVSTYIGKDKVRMGDIDKDFCVAFIRWLQSEYRTTWGNPLSPKSMSDYVGYFSTALNAAVRADIIPETLSCRSPRPSASRCRKASASSLPLTR